MLSKFEICIAIERLLDAVSDLRFAGEGGARATSACFLPRPGEPGRCASRAGASRARRTAMRLTAAVDIDAQPENGVALHSTSRR
jgi:hypothetical protein